MRMCASCVRRSTCARDIAAAASAARTPEPKRTGTEEAKYRAARSVFVGLGKLLTRACVRRHYAWTGCRPRRQSGDHPLDGGDKADQSIQATRQGFMTKSPLMFAQCEVGCPEHSGWCDGAYAGIPEIQGSCCIRVCTEGWWRTLYLVRGSKRWQKESPRCRNHKTRMHSVKTTNPQDGRTSEAC